MDSAACDDFDLTIVVVSYNTRDYVLPCLEAVFQALPHPRFEVLVVDNASSDGSADAIIERFPQVRLIRSNHNLGFAAANNLAAEQARGRLLLLLNPDTLVRDDTISAIVRFADRTPRRASGGDERCLPTGR